MSWSMESILEADVSAADVYRRYVDPSTWGQWAHNTCWGRARGPIRPGATVDVRVASYPYTYAVRILDLTDGRRVVCEVRPVGVRIVSTYDVAETPGGTARLHHTIEVSGPFERGYALLRTRYTTLLEQETRALADLVRRDGPAADRPAA